MDALEKFNSTSHRYIKRVYKEDGWLVIKGRIGRRNYLYCSLYEATIKYNKEVKRFFAEHNIY